MMMHPSSRLVSFFLLSEDESMRSGSVLDQLNELFILEHISVLVVLPLAIIALFITLYNFGVCLRECWARLTRDADHGAMRATQSTGPATDGVCPTTHRDVHRYDASTGRHKKKEEEGNVY
jgi:hypothetical protein